MSGSPAFSPAALSALSALSRTEFTAALGDIFEHSPWVAESAWADRPFDGLDALHAAMVNAMRAAPYERQLALIRAHPLLAGKAAAAGSLTADSRAEQASAGLDHCSADEKKAFDRLNAAYYDRNGFPFILAVKNRSRTQVLEVFQSRLQSDRESEFDAALAEIAAIARIRLAARLGPSHQ